jgi:hypothetical protein
MDYRGFPMDVRKGGRRKAGGGSKNLRSRNFMMKISCNDEWPEFYSIFHAMLNFMPMRDQDISC